MIRNTAQYINQYRGFLAYRRELTENDYIMTFNISFITFNRKRRMTITVGSAANATPTPRHAVTRSRR